MKKTLLTTSLIAGLFSPSLWAHHAMGGETPGTFIEGLISGLAHPVIGLDHLAFIVAIGLMLALVARPLLSGGLFLLATLAGALAFLAGLALPLNELWIALSVLAAGGALVILSGSALASILVVFSALGLFHGLAYAESILEAEPTPLLAYLIGFVTTQGIILVLVSKLGKKLVSSGPSPISLRLMGAVIAGVGLTFVVENGEQLVFSAI